MSLALVAGLAGPAPVGPGAAGAVGDEDWADAVVLGEPSEEMGGGAVGSFGDAVDHGSLAGASLAQPVVGMAASAGWGFWLVARDGGFFSFGDASFHGSTGAIVLNQPIVGMAATPSGAGYWLVASDGGIFSFGDARFFGSTGAIVLNQPIVGMAATPSGAGYWLIARDGGVFSFGDARFHGSTGAITLLQPIVGGAPSPSGGGYWLVAADGGVFTFGDATFHGSNGGGGLGQAVVSMAATADGGGYWLAGAGGAVGAHGSAPAYQPAWAPAPVVGMARTPSGQGFWLATSTGGVLSGTGGAGPGSDSYAFLSIDPKTGGPVRYNPCSVVDYTINPSGAPPGGVAEVREAFSRLSAQTGLTFRDAGTTSEGERTGGWSASQGGAWKPVLVVWTHLAGPTLGYGGSKAVWIEGNPTYDKAFVTGQVLLDTDQTGLTPGFGPGATRGNLILHELGHLVGLDHVGDPSQLLYGALSSSSPDGWAAGDRNGLARLGSAGGCLTVVPPG
ncbi:MAG: hypothetical protein AB7O29_05675 [Acidimicrobiia bacterium]